MDLSAVGFPESYIKRTTISWACPFMRTFSCRQQELTPMEACPFMRKLFIRIWQLMLWEACPFMRKFLPGYASLVGLRFPKTAKESQLSAAHAPGYCEFPGQVTLETSRTQQCDVI